MITKRGETPHLVIMKPDGSDIQSVARNVVTYSSPSWSPDGSQLAFCGSVNENNEILTVNIKSGTETRLTTNEAFDAFPDWH